jgi:hypothetical protein
MESPTKRLQFFYTPKQQNKNNKGLFDSLFFEQFIQLLADGSGLGRRKMTYPAKKRKMLVFTGLCKGFKVMSQCLCLMVNPWTYGKTFP